MPREVTVRAVAIGERDFRRLKRWAEAKGLLPEQLLARILGDERIRRKSRSG